MIQEFYVRNRESVSIKIIKYVDLNYVVSINSKRYMTSYLFTFLDLLAGWKALGASWT